MGGQLVAFERAHRLLAPSQRSGEYDRSPPLGEGGSDEGPEILQHLGPGRKREARVPVARAEDESLARDPLAWLGGGRGARSKAPQVGRVQKDVATYLLAPQLRASQHVPGGMERKPQARQRE